MFSSAVFNAFKPPPCGFISTVLPKHSVWKEIYRYSQAPISFASPNYINCIHALDSYSGLKTNTEETN